MSARDFHDRCMPGDVEVLTERGWRRGVELRGDERVGVWDPLTNGIALEPAAHVERGHYDGTIIALAGSAAHTTGNPEHGVWVRTPLGEDEQTWTGWHRRPMSDLGDLRVLRVPVAGQHSGPGLQRDYGDYAGVLGWVTVEDGYHGTTIHIRYTASNHHRALATCTRLTALGARRKRARAAGGEVDAWFLPGPLTTTMRRHVRIGLASWDAAWSMDSVELNAFVDGAAGGRRHTMYGLDRRTVDLLQAVGAMTGHRTTAHDVGRRNGGSVDIGIGYDAPINRRAIARRVDTWDGPAFALTTRTGAVIARRNWKVFVAAA